MSAFPFPCCKCEKGATVVASCPLCLTDESPAADCPNECEEDGQHVMCERCLAAHARDLHDWIPEAAALLAHAAAMQSAHEDAEISAARGAA